LLEGANVVARDGVAATDEREFIPTVPSLSLTALLVRSVLGVIRVFFEGNYAEWREIDADRVALTLPGDGVCVNAAEIADVTAAVRFGVRIQDFFVPTFTGDSDAISVTGDWGSVDGEDEDRAILRLTKISDDATLGVVEIDPFKAFERIIQLP